MRISRYLRQIVVVAALFWASVLAAQVTVDLDRDTIGTGEPVVLNVRIEGRLDEEFAAPRIDGLQYMGQSQQREIQFGMGSGVKQVQTFSFQYLGPEKVGVLSIPSFTVKVDGKAIRTEALTLNVEATAAHPRQGASSWQGRRRVIAPRQRNAPAQVPDEEPPQREGPLAYAEWVLPKKSGYVGEAIPAELRLYVAHELRWQIKQYPTITGDGFTMPKFGDKPSNTVVTRDGQEWDMVVFKTSVTPVKSGTITITPATLEPIIFVPQRVRLSPPAGFGSLFDDPFFEDALRHVAPKQMQVQTEPVEIEVKALPEEGRPAGFAGAVGRFELTTDAQPLRVKGGDPVNLTMKVGGTGNFERVTAPVLSESAGWQSYPPSSSFEGDDSLGLSGEKKFEMALIPDGAGADDLEKRELPVVEFSYFDPVEEKYVVLKSGGQEIVVSGGEKAPVVAKPAAPVEPKPEVKESEEIRFIRVDTGAWKRAHGPLWLEPWFLGVQGAALLAFVGWCGLNWGRNRPAPGYEVQLKARRASALRLARNAAGSGQASEFYDAAVDALEAHASLLNGGTMPLSCPATLGQAGLPLPEVEEIFTMRDRLRYAGGDEAADAGRVQVLQQELERWVKA